MPLITRSPDTGVWLLTTPRTSYALWIDETGAPCHVAWGPRLTPEEADTLAAPFTEPSNSFEGRPAVGEELPVDGGTRYGPPSLQVRYADGSRAFEWEPVGHRVDDSVPGREELVLEFRDRVVPLSVALHYRVRADTDVIERWTVLRNDGEQRVDLLRADSAAWTLPPLADYRLSHVTGQWSAETRLRRERLPHGETVLTSRRGITSHHANPWTMLDDGTADENRGRVWSTALAWSGSWRITVQRTPDGRAGLTGGVSHEGTRVPLGPGEEFTSPVSAGLFTDGGFGAASRAWHAYVRTHVLRHAGETAPVLYNSWEATGFDVDEASQLALAERAARLGVELYVVDDGWFGARRSDRAGLGDWTPTPDRFPRGLRPLSDAVHRLGMRFGVWVEPEMVNPDSDLYRAHPDWVLHLPGRPRSELRNQLVLNFARRDVADWAFDWLTRLVAEHRVDFLKWDMNRVFGESGWPGTEDGNDRLWTRYVHHLYGVLDRLREAHPELRIETCSGGRRPGRPWHPGPHRPGVDVRQHRRRGPAGHSAGLQPGVSGAGDVGLGDRRAQPAHPAVRAAALPVPRGHGRAARSRRRPHPLERGGAGRGRRAGGPLQGDPAPGAARRPVPARRPVRRRPVGRAVRGLRRE